ncbi:MULTISPECIES: hypothetical protein [unclassified Psychrobacter]|uniref:hypothetical protein n=1 Tax=unclassified Psychrobacter TaxID=196806 RepID=UPI00293D5864|nr:hypothetical protein [uncultured Psychrobacter sp.]
MQSTYLAFYIAEHGKALDKIISAIDRSPYSHCELIINELGNQHYDCISSSHRDGGLRRKVIDMTSGHWELVSVPCDIDYAVRWFNKRQRFKYDYLALIRTVVPGFYNPEHRVFCSEACADMLELVDPASYGLRKLYRWAKNTAALENE